MAAAAFKGNLAIIYASGRRELLFVSFSDVANAFATYPDSGTEFVFAEDALVDDIILDTGGTDTTAIEFWLNGKLTGSKIYNDNFLNTRQNRPINQNRPLAFNAGDILKLKQLA